MQQHLLTNFIKALDMFCHSFCSLWSLPCIVPGRTSEAHLFKGAVVDQIIWVLLGTTEVIYISNLQSSFGALKFWPH